MWFISDFQIFRPEHQWKDILCLNVHLNWYCIIIKNFFYRNEFLWQWRHSSLSWAVQSNVRLIDYLRFYVLLKNISLIWRRHHCRWKAAKFRPKIGAQGLWAGRDLYRATPAVTQDLGFSGLIRRTAPFSRLLRHTRGCGGSILTRILTGIQCENKEFFIKELETNVQSTIVKYITGVSLPKC
jgi:hypothetical protein